MESNVEAEMVDEAMTETCAGLVRQTMKASLKFEQ